MRLLWEESAWEEYSSMNKSYQQGTFDEEWAKVLAWRQEYQKILEEETE